MGKKHKLMQHNELDVGVSSFLAFIGHSYELLG